MQDVPSDAATVGEVVMRGNNVMCGYFASEEATQEAAGFTPVTSPSCIPTVRSNCATDART
jgi:acyl-CoA synthetase (AMP-forming)/AMP-acid ligase II